MKKKIIVVFFALISCIACVGLVACGHNHQYEDRVVPPTCTEDGYTEHVCSCGDSYCDNIIAARHTLNSVSEKKATCTKEGYSAYYICSECDKWFSDNDGHNEITNKDSLIIAKKPHNYVNGACTECGNRPTEGLEYAKIDGKEEYAVSGIGTATATDIFIPEKYNGLPVTKIRNSAFYLCSNLTSVTIPDSVTTIGSSAFEGCSSLTSVTIGNGVTSIGDYAFSCSSLTSVYYTGNIAGWCAIQGLKNLMSWYPTLYINGKKLTGELIIPDSVTTIGSSAFSGCSSLTSVTIGKSVTSIGDYAFSGCGKLIEVYNLSKLNLTAGSYDNGFIGANAKNVYTATSGASKLATTNDGYIFYEDGAEVYLMGYSGNDTQLNLPEKYNGKNYEIYQYAFYGCSSLISIIIPVSATSIGDYAFRGCDSLTSIIIPVSATSIGSYAFYGCSSLTSIIIPVSVTSIGRSTFEGCSNLTSIEFNGTIAQWNKIRKDYDWNDDTGNYTIKCTDGEIKK